MPLSPIEICNSALIKVGTTTIISFDDDTKASNVCKIRYDAVRRIVLRMHPWGCATKRAILAATQPSGATPVVGYPPAVPAAPFQLNTPVPPDYPPSFPYGPLPAGPSAGANLWGYRNIFPYPKDLLRLLAVGDDVRYRIEGRNLVSNENSLKVKYIWDLQDTTMMDELLGEAIACYLAWDICYAITQLTEMKPMLWKQWDLVKNQAKSVDSQEERDHVMEANLFTDSRINNAATVFPGDDGGDE